MAPHITIIGAGGLGAYYAAVLQRAGADVQLFVTPRHVAPIRESGIRVITDKDEFSVAPAAVTDQVDDLVPTPIVVGTVKTYQLEATFPATRAALTPGGIVVTLQNGVTSPGRLRAELGDGVVVPGLTGIVSAIEEPGLVRQRGPQPFVTMGATPLGTSPAGAGAAASPSDAAAGLADERADRDGSATTRQDSSSRHPLVTDLVEWIERAGCRATATADITRELWKKFMLISTMSGVGTLCHAELGEWRSFEPTRQLLLQAVAEVRAVANAHGILVSDGDEAEAVALLDRAAAGATASMQRDLTAGHASELSEQSGAVVRLAAEVGVAVPLHATITRVLSLYAHRGHV